MANLIIPKLGLILSTSIEDSGRRGTEQPLHLIKTPTTEANFLQTKERTGV